jgi:hypothetical protein
MDKHECQTRPFRFTSPLTREQGLEEKGLTVKGWKVKLCPVIKKLSLFGNANSSILLSIDFLLYYF